MVPGWRARTRGAPLGADQRARSRGLARLLPGHAAGEHPPADHLVGGLSGGGPATRELGPARRTVEIAGRSIFDDPVDEALHQAAGSALPVLVQQGATTCTVDRDRAFDFGHESDRQGTLSVTPEPIYPRSRMVARPRASEKISRTIGRSGRSPIVYPVRPHKATSFAEHSLLSASQPMRKRT